jgi:hypothetical protein
LTPSKKKGAKPHFRWKWGLAPFSLSLLLACAGQQQKVYKDYIDTWIGLSAERLTRMWGAPQNTTQLSDGSTLIEYREENVNRVAAPVTGGATGPVGVRVENRVSWCITRFTVRNGIIEKTAFRGADCRAP